MKEDPWLSNLHQIQAAELRIRPFIEETKIRRLAGNLYVKPEHEQITGSFKVRGALNKVLLIQEQELKQGVVCASAGNHGLGVALACAKRGVECSVVVPENAPAVKVDAIMEQGAEVIFAEGGYGAAETLGLEIAKARQSTWVSPYNDWDVIRGQGTIGLEIAGEADRRNWRNFKLYVPMSGGGLLSGIGLVIKGMGLRCTIVGVQTKAAPYLFEHFKGRSMTQVQELPTLADGLAGPVEAGAITLDLIPMVADEVKLVSETDIRSTIRWLSQKDEIVEPSAAVAIAAANKSHPEDLKVAVASGGNIDQSLLNEILEGGQG